MKKAVLLSAKINVKGDVVRRSWPYWQSHGVGGGLILTHYISLNDILTRRFAPRAGQGRDQESRETPETEEVRRGPKGEGTQHEQKEGKERADPRRVGRAREGGEAAQEAPQGEDHQAGVQEFDARRRQEGRGRWGFG